MRISLRWKILFLAVLTPATLGLATLFTVNRNVTAHVSSSSIHESLQGTAAVLESMLRTRSRVLVGGALVIARDPRFFSLLMLGPAQRDLHFPATVKSMARDFNHITQTELFEVLDRQGLQLASVGKASSEMAERLPLVRAALKGKTLEAILVKGDAHYQVALTPVLGGKKIVGVLLLGEQIGTGLARQLRSQMHCEVTFLSGRRVTGTSLSAPGDRHALVRALKRLDLDASRGVERLPVLQVRAPHALYLTLVRRIPASDTSTQQLYVMQRAFDPETSFLDIMQKDMIVLAVIALIAALTTGLLFSEQVLQPLQGLVRGAQEMERGNFDYPLRSGRRDEIGYLVDRFVEMRQREATYLGSLEQAMQLKSQFLSMASHELRTPISVLIGYRDMLASGQLGPVTRRQQEAFRTMRDHLVRLTRLAEDAARFARVTSERLMLTFQSHDIEPIVRRAVAVACAAGARRAVNIETVCDAVKGPVEADADSLEHAIVQLITNGIRFTPDGGQVEVHAQQQDDRLRIAVKDTGVGIAKEKLEALVSAGFAAVEANNYRSATGLEFNSHGLGLGLCIARAIAEAHGGGIRAESQLGEGSTFIIEIPMRHDKEIRAAA